MVKETRSEKIFYYTIVFVIIVYSIVVLLPLLNVVIGSLVSSKEVSENSIIPHKISLDAYKYILSASNSIIDGYKVTVLRVVVGTFLNMLFSCCLAYTISKGDLPGKKAITIFIYFIMLFSGGLIPYYIVVRLTHLYNNFWVYIIPGLVSVWNVLLLRNFIMQIPSSFSESAEIDGASEFNILFRIIMPLSVPAMVTIALFYAVAHWNDWFTALLFISDTKKYNLQYVLVDILKKSVVSLSGKNKQAMNALISNPPPSYAIQNAAVIITTLPIVIVYPFLQKYFIKGIMLGGVKG